MKMTITVAAALIGFAAAFGPTGTAPAASLPDGTPVIEVGGRDFGGRRSGHRSGGRDFGRRGGHRSGYRGGGRDFGYRGSARGHWRGHGRGHGRHGHGHGHNHYAPFIYGGIALGTYLFLDTIDHY